MSAIYANVAHLFADAPFFSAAIGQSWFGPGARLVVELSVGILMIGSLFWDPARIEWRNTRLQMDAVVDVKAPIRYGRLSSGRGNTYTMVFSRSLQDEPANLGQAKVVPCKRHMSSWHDLLNEAAELWSAESLPGRAKPGAISSDWGCVTLLINPKLVGQLRKDAETYWKHVSHSEHSDGIRQPSGPGTLIDGGTLQINWPRTAKSDEPVDLDLLLATATSPSLDHGEYADAQTVTDAWKRDDYNNLDYFKENQKHGIRTFQDDSIWKWLDGDLPLV